MVAAGAILTLQATSLTTGVLTFNGVAETDGAFNITGGGANDAITGGSGNDTLVGDNGNDSITAGLGNDTLTGGAGNDTFTLATVTGLTSADVVDGGAGTDTVALTGNTAFTAVTDFDNVRNIEAITLGNTNTAVTITTQDTLVAAGATLTISTTTTGGLAFNGAAETDGTFNITSSGASNDTLTGGAGADSMVCGTGTDTIAGGTNNDTFSFAAGSGLTTADTVNGGVGTDTVALTGNTAIAATNFDNVRNIETITLANTTSNVAITTLNTLVAAGAILTLQATSLTTGVLTFNGAAETDGTFNITGGVANDSITGGLGNDSLTGGNGNDGITAGLGNDTLVGGAGNDSMTSGAGNDSITGNAGADTIPLGSGADDNTRQTVIYSTTSDGAAAGANSGADSITQFDANANTATDDLIQVSGALKALLDDDGDGTLDYSTSDGIDLGNQAIIGGANQEATVLLDAEIEITLPVFTTAGLASLLTELGEEIDFTGIATGEEHLFIINFSTTQAAMVLYTAGSGGDDTIVATDIQVLGIVTHNDGTGLVASNMTF